MARDVIEINLTRLTLCLIMGLRSGVTVHKVSTQHLSSTLPALRHSLLVPSSPIPPGYPFHPW